jgi:ProP effector
MGASTSKRRRRQAARVGTIATLAKRFPAAFVVFERRRRPLKIGIHEDIIAAAPDLDRALLMRALSYTGNRCYLAALRAGAARVDLTGVAVDVVSAEHAAFAAQRVKKKGTKAPQRRPASTGPAPAGITALRAVARAAARGRT